MQTHTCSLCGKSVRSKEQSYTQKNYFCSRAHFLEWQKTGMVGKRKESTYLQMLEKAQERETDVSYGKAIEYYSQHETHLLSDKTKYINARDYQIIDLLDMMERGMSLEVLDNVA